MAGQRTCSGRNEAVGGHYVIGFRDLPERARPGVTLSDGRVLLWHCNYHPDGGQLFWPLDGQPFVVPVAMPGDDLEPGDFVAFWSDGSFGIYIHPGIWHEGVFPVTPTRPLLRQAGQGACPRELRPRARVRRAAERAAAAQRCNPCAVSAMGGASERPCRGWRTPGC